MDKLISRKKGIVVSKKTEKTVVVEVADFKTHKKYLKKYKASKRYKVHDEDNKTSVGQEVEIVPVRPMSKDKFYKIA